MSVKTDKQDDLEDSSRLEESKEEKEIDQSRKG